MEADLRDPAWVAQVPIGPYDAVLTTTALHWLRPAELRRVYREAAGLLAPGGVLRNGDHFGFPQAQPAVRRAVAAVGERRRRRATGEDWDAWWTALTDEPALAPLLERRRQLEHEAAHGPVAPSAALNSAALADAGFTEIATVWQDLDDRVLLAVR